MGRLRPKKRPGATKKEEKMETWICLVCGYVYDPAENEGVAFADLPEDWTCPLCGAGKDQFEKQG